jgi:PAS domain S-box-containing protein
MQSHGVSENLMTFETPERQQRLERMLETAPMIVFVYDLPAKRLTYSNCALHALLGYRPEELEYGGFSRVTHPDEQEMLKTVGVQLADADDDHVCEYECRLQHKDGSWRWMYHRMVVFERDAVGRTQQVLGTAIDISARKAAELALQEANVRLEHEVAQRTAELEQANRSLQQQERVYHTMLRNLPNSAIFLIDHDLRFLVAEGTALRAAGFVPEEIVGRYLTDNVDGTHAEILRTYYNHVMQGRQHESSEQLYNERYYAIQALPIRDEQGEIYAAMVLAQDITERRQAEQARHESEQRFRLIFDNAPLGIAIVDYEGYCQESNAAFQQMLGYSATELRMVHINAFTHPEDIANERMYLDAINAGRRMSYAIEKRYIRKDGSVIWVRLQSSLARDAHSGLTFSFGIVEDITERKLFEQALQASEARFRNLFAVIPVGIAVADHNNYCYLTNPAFQQMLGYSAEELAGMTYAAFTHPDDQIHEYEIVQQFYAGKRASYAMETRYICKDGRMIWVQLHAMGASGMLPPPAVGFAVAIDITERKQIEQQLRRSRDLLRTLFDGLPEPLLLVNRDADVLSCNQRFAALLQLPPDAVVGQAWCHIHQRLSENQALALLGETLADGKAREERVRLTQTDGQVRVFDVRTLPLLAGEQLERIILHMVDITETLQLQARIIEHERFVANGMLAASVAHEINTPLQTVAYALHFARQAPPDELDSYLQPALEEIERAGRIVGRFLELYRPDNQQPRAVHLNQLIESLILLLGKRFHEHAIVFNAHLDPDLPDVLARPDELSQILLNLLINALEAMPTGGNLAVSTRPVTTAHPYVEIQIRDSGGGIDPALQSHIFEPFVSNKSNGTGLGLAICKQLVTQYHGSIRVISQPGRGSTFIVTLPIT